MRKAKKCNTRSLYFPEHITRALDDVFDYPLTIVEAPIGYGKTTVVREYLGEKQVRILWQKIQDDGINHFWTGFCRQLNEVDVLAAQSLVELGFPNDSVSRQQAWNIMASIHFPSQTVLVIDDYHMVAHNDINYFIEYLVQNETQDLHLVLTTRYTTLPNLEELSLKGYLNHITKEQFEFSTKDIKAYYKVCGVNLKDEEAERLYKITEGWISALYLLLLNYLEEGTFSEVSNIYRLVEKAVYMPFSDEIKSLLLMLSLFESFTLEQAVHMWQNRNVEVLLDEVLSKNALIKYDSKTRTYQMHNLFMKLLKELFMNCDEAYKKSIYSRAAQWFLNGQNYEAAFRHFSLAEEYDQLLTVVEIDRGHCINSERKQAFIGYFTNCPKDIKQRHPVALLIFAMAMFTFNEIELFQEICGDFVAAVYGNPTLDQDERNKLLGEFEVLQCFTGYNDIWKMLEHLQKASILLKGPVTFIDTTEGWTFGSPSVLYMFYRESGHLEQEMDSIKIALPYYHRLTGGHGLGGDYALKAEWFFQHGDFENAEIVAHKTIQEASSANQGDVVICAKFLLLRMALFKGDAELVQNRLHDIRCYADQQKKFNLMHTLELCEAWIHMEMKNVERVPAWILQGEFDSSRLYFPARAFMNIVYGRALIERGEMYQVLGISEPFMEIASVFPNLLGQIYTHIYVAIANEKIFRHDQALIALKQALDIAMIDKVYMPFVENSAYIGDLLRELARHALYIEDISKIRNLYSDYNRALAQINSIESLDNRQALSDREAEIANLAAEGYSNKEIGERLFISQNTVKTQLKSVFQKLDINSRVLLKQYLEETN